MSNADNPGLYIHVPFCPRKCPYCDFYSITPLSLVPDWLGALQQEIMAYKDRCEAFDSLYLGGGTPSILSARDLGTLFEGLFRHFTFLPDTEVTLEVNPDDVTSERLVLLKSLGVTRISLGVQSFDSRELGFLGRRHTALQAEQAIDTIRRCGFTNLGLDLMYALPGQTASHWIGTMARALDYHPEHLSCYQLTVHEGTPLSRILALERVGLPDEDEERTFFLLTAQYLAERGYIHYEISNFAREEACMARHNSKYWRRASYLGLGPSAHSFWEGIRWWNVKSVRDYCKMLSSGTLPVAGSERLTDDQERLESLCLGLRTREGVDLSILRGQPDADKILAQLKAANLVEVQGGRVVPTREGFAVADSLPILLA